MQDNNREKQDQERITLVLTYNQSFFKSGASSKPRKTYEKYSNTYHWHPLREIET